MRVCVFDPNATHEERPLRGGAFCGNVRGMPCFDVVDANGTVEGHPTTHGWGAKTNTHFLEFCRACLSCQHGQNPSRIISRAAINQIRCIDLFPGGVTFGAAIDTEGLRR